MQPFFNAEETKTILSAIAAAELRTSGEIRVHVSERGGKDTMADARAAFEKLGMRKTEQHSGVLFYIAVKDKKFAILGDDAINAKVPAGFWENIKEAVITKFREKEFALGLAGGIALVGEKLAEYFPAEKEDKNELPDGISYE